MKRTFNEEAREFSESVHKIADLIVVALAVPMAWLAGHAIRLCQWVEQWMESRKE